ncbi:protein phosphatase 1 regulatory subunit 36 isoform X3 [Megalobrama amblycephala]|uniref:protein phosphatase 1 regulatory subunit 36 isoform X3 n=1 Tax=Megalobrama amblycephala TaxID=75352 RepID=UPI002013C33B|nr:protein phosphatase 1 regulatory subunit 36 isoform X3 [Megalobrama amblycephala]
MAKSPNETVTMAAPPSSGRWTCNDQTLSLEFISFEAQEEEKKQKNPKSSAYQERIRQYLEKWQKNTATPAQLDAFKNSVKRSQKAHVTIQDVKLAAVCLLQENEGYPIPPRFLPLLKSKEMDVFLANLLLYFSCFFEKKTLEKKPKSLMGEDSDTERRMVADTCDLALKQLALSYSSLLLGEAPSQQHLVACDRFKVSSTHSDIQLDECLYSFYSYAVWVTFERRDLKVIQQEIGRLFRSDSFNPALNEPGDRSESMEPQRTALNNRRSERRPALNKILTQCSPLMVSLLPTPQENAPHLFGGFRRGKRPSTEGCDSEALMEGLKQQLKSLSFGILGKPLSQFSSKTLKPQEGQSEDEEDEGDEGNDGEVVDPDPQVHIRSRKTSVMGQRSLTTTIDGHIRSRRDDLASRATTEAVSSDTE